MSSPLTAGDSPGSPAPTAAGDVSKILAGGVTTFQTALVSSIATAVGGFYSYREPVTAPVAGPVYPSTTLDQVLAEVARTIVGAGIVAEACAFVSLEPEPFPKAGNPQVVLSPGDFAARAAHQLGMGRNLATEDGSFTVHVADRNAQDQGGRDLARLTGKSSGLRANLLALAHEVKDLLNAQFVEDADGNLLSIEPVFFREQSRPRRYELDPLWAGIDLTFSLSYVAKMSATPPSAGDGG